VTRTGNFNYRGGDRNRETGPSNQRDNDRIRRLESLRASEIPVDAIDTWEPGDVQAALAALGALVSIGAGLVDAVDDAAAATAGVPVGAFYRNGSVVMVRVV
jgi:hypothetical protein